MTRSEQGEHHLSWNEDEVDMKYSKLLSTQSTAGHCLGISLLHEHGSARFSLQSCRGGISAYDSVSSVPVSESQRSEPKRCSVNAHDELKHFGLPTLQAWLRETNLPPWIFQVRMDEK